MRRIALFGLAIGLGFATIPARGEDPPDNQDAIVEPMPRFSENPKASPRPAPPVKNATTEALTEAATARKFAIEKLRQLGQPVEKGKTRDKETEARVAALREVYKARERVLLQWEETLKSRQAVENPDTTPEAEIDDLKASLSQTMANLALAPKEPSSLLPPVFRIPVGQTTDAILSDMKAAIDAGQEAVDEAKKEAEALSSASKRKAATPLTTAKLKREEIRKRIVALGARGTELENALAAAATPEERELARERIVNLDWEGRAEAELLKETEARIDLETRRAPLADLKNQLQKARVDLAQTTLDLLQSRYRERVDRQLNDLKRASATEQARADHASDPLERYRARRAKEENDQQALLTEKEKEANATPAVSLEEQRKKAEKSAEDFEHLKQLVVGGRSTTLVAQRLNNSFRRLGTERASIVRKELAQITLEQARYENELTDVELDQLNDIQGDQTLRDNLLAQLPESRRAQANALFQETELKTREILEKRRQVLAKLASRADKTREQVLLRLQILDDQHTFVRTHLFWVRDTQPIGAMTIEQIRREARDLGRTIFGIATEPWSSTHWERVSPEFGLAAIGLVTLPYGLYRIRKALRRMLDRTREGRTSAMV